MDDPNITIEEYIRLEEEKSRRNGKVYNWETTTYGKIWYDNDIYDHRSVETEFLAIVFNDELKSEEALSCEPTVSPLNIMKLTLEYRLTNPTMKITRRIRTNMLLEASHDKINKIFNVESFVMELDVNITAWNYLNNGMVLNLIKNLYVPFGIPFDPSGFIRMSFKRGSCGGQDMALPPRYQRHQYLRFEGLGYTNADIIDFEERLGRIYGREIHQGVFTSQAWRRLFEIRGPLVHELILEFFSTFRFGEAMLDLDTAGALQFQLGVICEELDDTWAWVASGPERQQVAAAGAPVVAKDDPVVDEGVSAVPAPVQAPQAPPAAGPARTMTHRLARQEEDVHGMRGALGEQREVLDSMARDFSRLTTWTVTGLSRMMDQAGVRCAAINLDPNLSTITRPLGFTVELMMCSSHALSTFASRYGYDGVIQFKEFFASKRVNSSDSNNKSHKQYFKDYTGREPQVYRHKLIICFDELERLLNERARLIEDLRMKEREVEAIKEIKKRLNEQKMQTQESLVTEGAALKASLVTEGIALEDNLVTKETTYDSVPSSEQLDESNISGNDADAEKILVETVASNIENTDIEPSYDSDTMSEVHHDTFENVFAHRIQNHNQPESIPNTHAVNENNSDIISDIPNMDPVRDKEEHDFVDDEHQRAFSASLVKNLKSKVENYTKVNREAQQANALLTKRA
ncbi:hypothetical protein Tco_1185383 [Tanacetum coccineum]